MTKQKYVFLQGEADCWFERNREKLDAYNIESDQVVAAMRKLDLKPKRVLEFGCSTGRRLAALRDTYGCDIMGVEPSQTACIVAASRRVPVVQGTASSAAVQTPFDLVIYGHCLYVTDPNDWLQIAAEGNNVLSTGGHLIIHDFADASYGALSKPFAREYAHRDGVMSYHFWFASLWLTLPYYEQLSFTEMDAETGVWVLRKNPLTIPVLP